MPMLARTKTSFPSSANGASNAFMMRLAMSMCVVSSESSSRIANSSPPSRAGVSAGRRQSRSRSPHSRSSCVAARVAERVVHGLEVVEVDEEHRDRVDVAAVAVERVRDAVLEQRAVRETRQLVVERLVEQLLLEVLALADVADVEHDAADVGVLLEVRAQRLGEDVPAIGAPQPELVRARPVRGRPSPR